MRFVHTADVHWGMVPDSDKPWAKDRANDIRQSFSNVISKCKEIGADCLLISGDLFHRQPLSRDLKEINYLFSTIPSTHVVIIAGNHDRIQKNSALMSFQWSPNVTYLMSETPESIYFDDINTEIHGFSYHSSELKATVIDQISYPPDHRIHILMAHGGDASHMPVDLATLRSLPFNYIALGHIHKPAEVIEHRAVYPGSLEPLDLTETGTHGIYAGDINPITGVVQRLEFIPIAETAYIPLQICVTKETTNSELLDLVKTEIQRRGTRNIYRLRITGMHDPDIEFDLSVLDREYRIVEICDESEPQYDFSALFREHPSDMIGYYIRTLQKENSDELSYIEKKALYYGINALLKTSEDII